MLKGLTTLYHACRAPVRLIFLGNILILAGWWFYIPEGENLPGGASMLMFASLVSSPIAVLVDLSGVIWLIKRILNQAEKPEMFNQPFKGKNLISLIFDVLLLIPGLLATGVVGLFVLLILSHLIPGSHR